MIFIGYMLTMAGMIIFNEFTPNKYTDNVHLLMVLFYCFAGLASCFNDIYTEKMIKSFENAGPEKIKKGKVKINLYYSFIFGNAALCFVLGWWLRGIYLVVGGISFVSANNRVFEALEKK